MSFIDEIVEKLTQYDLKMFREDARRYLFFFLIALIVLPLAINILSLHTTPYTAGDQNTWIPFFGSYLGFILGAALAGGIGGLVAFLATRLQLAHQSSLERQRSLKAQLKPLKLVKFELANMKDSVGELAAHCSGFVWANNKYDENWQNENEVENWIINFRQNNPHPWSKWSFSPYYERSWDDIGLIDDIDLLNEILTIRRSYDRMAGVLSEDLSNAIEGIVRREMDRCKSKKKKKKKPNPEDPLTEWLKAYSSFIARPRNDDTDLHLWCETQKKARRMIWDQLQKQGRDIVNQYDSILKRIDECIAQIEAV